jgi:aldehyde dehydrogenase (NAD+)
MPHAATAVQKSITPILTSTSDIPAIVESQRRFFATGKTRDVEFRLEALKKLQKLLTEREAEITEALKLDLHKPELEAYSTEIANVLEDLKGVMKNLRKWARPQKISSPLVVLPAKSRIYSEPFGVTLIIAPWNYPFQLQIAPLIGALAAGNTAVLKPSEITPHTQRLLMRLMAEIFPREYVACVGGGVEETQALLNERFDFIFFTGSTRVGRIVMEKAARNLTPVVLELGGKSPCIVDKNVNLKVTTRRIAWGKFMNSGQSCVAPDYLLIHKDIYQDFIKEFQATVKEFFGDDARQSASFGRVVNQAHTDRLASLIDPKKVVFGGKVVREERYVEPTLMKDVAWTDKVMEDEIFGPVLPVMSYDNLDEVIRQINARPKPLSLYVFSSDSSVQQKVVETASYGGACVNDTMVHLANPDLPFGGVGESGMGSYHGQKSFDVFSHKKSVMIKPFWGDATMRYAPYTDMKLKLIRFFMG